jgi:prepilin-type N-terminal cleavage/methylation domain-containing protein
MSMHSQSHSIRSAGFTLIEVLIAMLIGIVTLIVMMQTFAVSGRLQAHRDERQPMRRSTAWASTCCSASCWPAPA